MFVNTVAIYMGHAGIRVYVEAYFHSLVHFARPVLMTFRGHEKYFEVIEIALSLKPNLLGDGLQVVVRVAEG